MLLAFGDSGTVFLVANLSTTGIDFASLDNGRLPTENLGFDLFHSEDRVSLGILGSSIGAGGAYSGVTERDVISEREVYERGEIIERGVMFALLIFKHAWQAFRTRGLISPQS